MIYLLAYLLGLAIGLLFVAGGNWKRNEEILRDLWATARAQRPVESHSGSGAGVDLREVPAGKCILSSGEDWKEYEPAGLPRVVVGRIP